MRAKDGLKICPVCGEEKTVDLFNKNKSRQDGLSDECKKCTIARFRSKNGVVTAIYGTERRASRGRSHPMPTYTRDELQEWLYAQPDFHTMYDNWKRLDYQKAYKPSVDRIDDSIGYTMANIQLMTWQENLQKHKDQLKSCELKVHHRAVIQKTLDGEVIGEYLSISEAARALGMSNKNISAVCKGKRTKAGGFKWAYLNNKNKG